MSGTAGRFAIVDAEDGSLVAIKSEWLAVTVDAPARSLEIAEGRFCIREVQVHQPTGSVINIDQQRATRATILGPGMAAAVDLDEFADALTPIAGLIDLQ